MNDIVIESNWTVLFFTHEMKSESLHVISAAPSVYTDSHHCHLIFCSLKKPFITWNIALPAEFTFRDLQKKNKFQNFISPGTHIYTTNELHLKYLAPSNWRANCFIRTIFSTTWSATSADISTILHSIFRAKDCFNLWSNFIVEHCRCNFYCIGYHKLLKNMVWCFTFQWKQGNSM